MKTIEFLCQAVEGVVGDLEKDSHNFEINFEKYHGEGFEVFVKAKNSFETPEGCYNIILSAFKETGDFHNSGNFRYYCERASGTYTYEMTFKVEFYR